jgi:uncharacterized damage-inducible protein DinB
MTFIESLRTEFQHEAASTRKALERVPEGQLDWQPHEKSFSARDLVSHIVECVGWAESICTADEFNFDPATFKPFRAASIPDLLAVFDQRVDSGARAMAGVTDVDLMKPWRLAIQGRVRFEKPKLVVLRDFTLNHLIHHRGQLSVYLRLLNVPVPGAYGPTADERG